MKGLAVWVLLMLLLFPFAWSDHFNGDEFHFLTQVRRILAGEVPTRDFFEFVMPGSLFLTAGWFKLTGASLLAARLLQSALVAAMAMAYYGLGRKLGFGRGLALLPPAMLLGLFYTWQPGYSHHWFGQVGVGLAMVSLWWALGSRRDVAWLAVGTAVGLTYLAQQLTGAALFAGIGLGALWTAWREGWAWGSTLRRAGMYLAGMSAPLLLLAGYFALQGTLGPALWMTHVWSLSSYRSVGNHNDVAYLTDLAGMLSPARLWFNLGYWYAGLVVYVFAALLPLVGAIAGGAWLLGLGRQAPDRRRTFLGMATIVGGCLFLASTRGRADLAHIVWMAPIWGLVLAAAIAGWQKRASGRLTAWLPGALAYGVVGCHLVMEVVEFQAAPQSVMSLETPDQRIQSREAFVELGRRLAPSDTVLAINGAAEATLFYFYLAPNPTRYTSWTFPGDGYTTPQQFEEIRRTVALRRPRFVLYPHFTPDVPDQMIGRYFPAYRRVTVVPFPELVPWVKPRSIFVYELPVGS